MRMDKLTSKFQSALADAQSLALGKDHQFIEPIHLMMALVDQDGGSVKPLLAQMGVNTQALRSELSKELARIATVTGSGGDVQFSNELVRLLNVTDKLAQKRNDKFISSELFLLAVFEEKGTLQDVLKKAGVRKEAVEKAIDKLRSGQS
ncbi:MAG: Clp protease N-terminal domain-containing protein, partial [Methylobacter sp.]